MNEHGAPAAQPMPAPPAPALVFDLTDLVMLLHRKAGVGGIARVVLEILRHVAARADAEGMALVFHHPTRGIYVAIDPAVVSQALEEPAALIHGLGLADAYFPINELKYRGRPLRAWYRRWRRHMRFRRKVRHVPPRGETRPAGWALRDWRLPQGPVRLAVLGTAWALDDHPMRLRELAAQGDVEVVLLVHDLIPFADPPMDVDNPEFRDWFAAMAVLVRRYLSVSAYTGREIAVRVPALGGHVDRLDVVPLAHVFDYEGEAGPAGIAGEYVLTIGSLGYPRKNFLRLMEAWALLHARLGAELPKLVIAGSHGGKSALLDSFLARHPALAGHIALVDRPDDARLAGLYKHCLFSVYPSLFEGWGLPVGESAWFGRFCVASHASSIPEVVGAAADYFDPNSAQDMADKLERPMRDRDYLRAREAEVAALHLRTWDEVARDLVAALRAQ
ncbi:glycosyltransferase family 4 protein [Ancylobacter sp. A5.8]|uniref:glycosyltransferase family 4 protein n=1 Tax=Ancylobacter gelatini TaxID=2919920 RepID=UPI001F4D9396|nr:glycosyltransferase family 1 protein [Ancylobacter gelatini]MCJ8142116.1 glycosyltransferase family 4 protein [Ancylobacter gelatini]